MADVNSDRVEMIKAVLGEMNHSDDSLWDGVKPRADYVAQMSGYADVTREELDALAPNWGRLAPEMRQSGAPVMKEADIDPRMRPAAKALAPAVPVTPDNVNQAKAEMADLDVQIAELDTVIIGSRRKREALVAAKDKVAKWLDGARDWDHSQTVKAYQQSQLRQAYERRGMLDKIAAVTNTPSGGPISPVDQRLNFKRKPGQPAMQNLAGGGLLRVQPVENRYDGGQRDNKSA